MALPPVFVKHGVEPHEVAMQQAARHILPGHVPDVLSYDAATKTLRMEAVDGMSLADFYGEDAAAVPPALWPAVRRLVAALLEGGLAYPDITGYNFMLDKATEQLYVIDFEHASPVAAAAEAPPFVRDFASGAAGARWNPDFA